VVDDLRSLFTQNSSEADELPKSETKRVPLLRNRTYADFEERTPEQVALETQVADLASEQVSEYKHELVIAIDYSEPAGEMIPAQQAPEDLSNASKQPTGIDWATLHQLRDAESSLQKIDTQIQTLNSKLEKSNSGEIIKRELSPVLQKQQNLRSAKTSEIVELIDNSGISAYHEERHNIGRVVLEPKYASAALLQAKSWFEVVLAVGNDRTQLIKAIQSWSMESKQLLAQLLSEYLEEPNAFEQIDWIPEDLLLLALAKLSFQLQRFKKTDNLVDEPEIEYLTGCQLSSFSNLGTRREQWVFLFEGNLIPVFGRDEFLVERV